MGKLSPVQSKASSTIYIYDKQALRRCIPIYCMVDYKMETVFILPVHSAFMWYTTFGGSDYITCWVKHLFNFIGTELLSTFQDPPNKLSFISYINIGITSIVWLNCLIKYKNRNLRKDGPCLAICWGLCKATPQRTLCVLRLRGSGYARIKLRWQKSFVWIKMLM